MKTCNSESINNANLLGLVYSHEFNAYMLYYTYMILTINKCSALLEIIYQRERVDLFGKEKNGCTYPRSRGSRSFSLNDPESWSLSDMLALKWEKHYFLWKIDWQQFWKKFNSYRIFNPNALLVFLLLLPFSLRKTVYHDHHQEL